jgi:hypothetical protein
LFTQHGVPHNAYCNILRKLHKAIQWKQPGLLTKGVLLLHDNACPNTANKTNETLQNFKWEVLEHPPLLQATSICSALLNIIFRLNIFLSPDDEAVEREVTAWFQQQPKEFYAAGFQGLVKQWDKCLSVQGDYVEK